MNIVGSPISKQVVSCLVFLSFSFLSSVSRANSEGLNNDSGSSKSVPMSPGAIYARCFAVFTGTAVNPKDLTHAEVLSQLEKGDKSYVDACMNVLSRANLDSTTQRISSDSDAIAVNVLKTFQDFNASIFTFRRNSEFPCQNSFNNDLLDPDEPSFHLTRLLFYSETPFSSLVTDNRLIRAIRSSGVPRVGPRCQVNKDGLQGPTSGTHVLNGYYGSAPVPVNGQADMPKLMPSIPFSQTGELLGLDNRTENLAFLIPSTALAAVKEVNFFKTYGGGVLGSPAFIFNTLAKRNIKTNGELDMHRRWSVAVMTDLLCRDLPAIRLGDGSPYLVKNPDAAPFRKMNSCLQCHSTLDRAAGVVRSLSGVNAASGAFCNQAVKSKSDNRLYRINFPMVVHDWPTKASSGPVWPDLKDVDYYQRPSQGVLYYRSYDGKLINIGVSNLDEMGSALANTNDLYVCAAKRYYNMMTGISVSLSDINDPFNPIGLSEEDLFHRNQVIDLGLKLKKHQSLRELIRQIISLPTFRLQDFGISGGHGE